MFQNENIVKYILKILSRRARFEKCFILVWNNLECTNLCTSCMKKIQNFPKSMEEHCKVVGEIFLEKCKKPEGGGRKSPPPLMKLGLKDIILYFSFTEG